MPALSDSLDTLLMPILTSLTIIRSKAINLIVFILDEISQSRFIISSRYSIKSPPSGCTVDPELLLSLQSKVLFLGPHQHGLLMSWIMLKELMINIL